MELQKQQILRKNAARRYSGVKIFCFFLLRSGMGVTCSMPSAISMRPAISVGTSSITAPIPRSVAALARFRPVVAASESIASYYIQHKQIL